MEYPLRRSLRILVGVLGLVLFVIGIMLMVNQYYKVPSTLEVLGILLALLGSVLLGTAAGRSFGVSVVLMTGGFSLLALGIGCHSGAVLYSGLFVVFFGLPGAALDKPNYSSTSSRR